ncbi:hypothetical protein GCM10020220_057530 [Nonomuraea rubra]
MWVVVRVLAGVRYRRHREAGQLVRVASSAWLGAFDRRLGPGIWWWAFGWAIETAAPVYGWVCAAAWTERRWVLAGRRTLRLSVGFAFQVVDWLRTPVEVTEWGPPWLRW